MCPSLWRVSPPCYSWTKVIETLAQPRPFGWLEFPFVPRPYLTSSYGHKDTAGVRPGPLPTRAGSLHLMARVVGSGRRKEEIQVTIDHILDRWIVSFLLFPLPIDTRAMMKRSSCGSGDKMETRLPSGQTLT